MENGQWKISSGVFFHTALRTPQDTVSALREALARRSMPGFLRLLARSTRRELEHEITRLLEQTTNAEDLEVVIEGNHATIRTPGGGELRLVREADEWRVLDIR
jgi:hypothetical protein